MKNDILLAEKDAKLTYNLKRIVLDNGLTVILKKKSDIPLVSFQLYVKSGSVDETKHLGSGLSHYFEHMLGRKTSKNEESDHYYLELKRMGAKHVNAFTSNYLTGYHATIHKKYLERSLRNLEEILSHSIFDKEAAANEIQVILKEYNMRVQDSVEGKLYVKLLEMMFKKHPMRYSVIGYPEILMQLSEKEILEYYKDKYAPNNLVLVLVGDFELNSTEKLVQDIFSVLKRKSIFPSFIAKEPKQFYPRIQYEKIKSDRYTIFMGWPLMDPPSLKDLVLTEMLNFFLNSKSFDLYEKLKIKENLVWGYHFGLYVYPHLIKTFLEVNLSKDQFKEWDKVKDIIFNEIYGLAQKPISKDLLKKIQDRILFEYEKRMSSGYYLSKMFAIYESLYDIQDLLRLKDSIKKITSSDLQEFAAKIFKKTSLNMLIGEPEEVFLKKESDLMHKLDKKQSQFDQNNFIKEVQSRIKKESLENGIDLIFIQDDQSEISNFSLAFKLGQLYNKNDEFDREEFLEDLLFKGTKDLSEKEIQSEIDRLGFLSSRYHDTYFEIFGNALKYNIEELLELATKIVSESEFNEKNFNYVKEDLVLAYKNAQEHNIFQVMQDEFWLSRLFNEKDRYNVDLTINRIEKMQLKDFEDYYKKYFNPKNMIVTIVGNFNKEKIHDILKKIKWPKESVFHKKEIKAHSIPSLKSIIRKEKEMKKGDIQSFVQVTFDGPKLTDVKELVYLKLVHSIFSGIGNPLFQDLRDKKGLVYSTGAKYSILEEQTFIHFYALTEFSKKEIAEESIINILEDAADKFITKEHFDMAKNHFVTELLHKNETLAGNINFMIKSQILDIPNDYKKLQILDTVELDDLKKFFKKYVNLSKYIINVVNPPSEKKKS